MEDSAGTWALAWLGAVVVIDGDPDADAAIWTLTHSSWRRALAAAFLGSDYAALGDEQDVTSLDDGAELARYAALRMREALPASVRAMGLGDKVGRTQIEAPESIDRVVVVFNDDGLDPGRYEAPTGARVGFALTVVRESDGWTVESVQRDWLMPEWLTDLSQRPDLDR